MQDRFVAHTHTDERTLDVTTHNASSAARQADIARADPPDARALPTMAAAAQLPNFAPPGRRADTLSIKAKLSEVLSPEHGALYWASFGALLSGKITAAEFELDCGKLLSPDALALHNALVLAVLYNTTRPALAPPSSIRHAGWSRRKRRPVDEEGDEMAVLARSLDPREHKRRRIRDIVLSLSKRDRQRIRDAALVDPPISSSPAASQLPPIKLGQNRSKLLPNVVLTDYARARQTQWSSESGLLPDRETMRDRMNLAALNSGLTGGIEPHAVSYALLSLEHYLKTLMRGIASMAPQRNEATPLGMDDLVAYFDAHPQSLISPISLALERRRAIAPFEFDESGRDEDMDVDEVTTRGRSEAATAIGTPSASALERTDSRNEDAELAAQLFPEIVQERRV